MRRLNTNGNLIVNADALSILKLCGTGEVNTIITSPPYYRLRDYGVDGQIGLETYMDSYIANLVIVFREAKRVLKDDGTLWLNLGDSYSGSGKNAAKYKQGTNHGVLSAQTTKKKTSFNLPPKNLIGIPWRVAFALQEDGWILRQDIIWHKPNPMPESVKDRCTKAHEYIFLFSKSRKYYFDSEAIKEPCVGSNQLPVAGSKGALGMEQTRQRKNKGNRKTFRGGLYTQQNKGFNNSEPMQKTSHGNIPNAGFKNKRDVWTVAIGGHKANNVHYATFPEELIEPCVLAGCPEGGIVLDMFMGSGTTCCVAKRLKRHYIGIDINQDYYLMAKKRLSL